MLLQMPFLELLYLHRLVNCSCRCFFLLICKNIHPQLVFSLLADTLLQKFASATCFFSACRYSPAKICIRNFPFLYLADTLLQKFASTTCLFSILQILPCKKFASATCSFSILQILPCSNTLFY